MANLTHHKKHWSIQEFGLAWWLAFGRAIDKPTEKDPYVSEFDKIATQAIDVMCNGKKPHQLTYQYPCADKKRLYTLMDILEEQLGR